MACSSLQCFAILHHCLNRKRLNRSRESLISRLATDDHGHCHPILGKVCIDIDHLLCLGDCLFAGGMHRVTFLPQELCCSQKHSRTHFPSHHIRPLVDQDGQIAMTLDPFGIGRANDRLAGWTYDQGFLKLAGRSQSTIRVWLEAMMSYHRTFFGKSLHVLSFLFKKAHRNEEGKISILVARRLEHVIQGSLHVFPQPIAPWFDHHAATNGTIFGQV